MNMINHVVLFIILWNQMSAGVVQRSNKLNDLRQKPDIENASNSSTMELKKDWDKYLYDTDDLDRKNMIINRSSFAKRSEKGYGRSTEPERELNKSNKDCYVGTHAMIRIFSLDYKMPVLNSDSEIRVYSVIATILYSTIVVIGITICIIVYRKYGFDKNEHRCIIDIDKLTHKHVTNIAVLDTGRLKDAMIKKCLLDDRPPSYGACVV